MAERERREIVKGPNGFGSVRTLDVFRRDTVCTKNSMDWPRRTDRFATLIQIYSMLNNLCNIIKCIAYMRLRVCVCMSV